MKPVFLVFLLLSSLLFPAIVAVHIVGSSSETVFPGLDTLFAAGAKWAANGGMTVAYVDFYDNLVAYPNPSILGAGGLDFFLQMKNATLSMLEGDGFTVDTFPVLPANFTQYSLLFLEAYCACSPDNASAIASYINGGGGVVFKAGSMNYLVYDSNTIDTGYDLSSIAPWFGAAAYTNTGGTATVSVANPLGTSLNLGDKLVTGVGYSSAGVSSMSNDSQVLATWADGSTFAFTHTYGEGRVYYQVSRASDANVPPSSQPPNPNPPNPNPPNPPPNTSVFLISPSSESLNVNDSFSFTVNLTNAENLFSWQVVLKYNGTDLRLNNMWIPDNNVFSGHTVIPEGPVTFNAADGSLFTVIGGMLLGSDLIANVDSGVLCNANFTVMNAGQSLIELAAASNPAISDKGLNWHSFWQTSNDALFGAEEDALGSNCTVSASATNTSAVNNSDAEVTNISPDHIMIYQGQTAYINVTVSNLEAFSENVWVTLYFDVASNKIINEYPLHLEANQNCTLQFAWNTAGLPCLKYTLTAIVTTVTDASTPTNTNMTIRLMGDVNGDGRVDLRTSH